MPHSIEKVSQVSIAAPVPLRTQEDKSIVDSLATISGPVSNTNLVNAVSNCLGLEFEILVTAIKNFDALLDFSKLRYHLLNYEARQNFVPITPLASLLAS